MPELPPEALSLIVAMLLTGVVGGLLAGLLGIGGGIVIVPVLFVALGVLGIDSSIRMHIAVATSLATIIPTSISSAWSHYKHGAVDADLARLWSGPIFVGAVAGVYVASQVQSQVLTAVFASVALLVAVKMLLPLDDYAFVDSVPRGPASNVIPFGIGAISTMMGLGGGVLGVPVLTLCRHPIHLAVGTAAVFGLVISLPATAGYLWAGWGHPLLPAASVGYVNLIGVLLIAPLTVLTAPVGARIAHRISRRRLSLLFGVFLLLASVRLFYSLLP